MPSPKIIYFKICQEYYQTQPTSTATRHKHSEPLHSYTATSKKSVLTNISHGPYHSFSQLRAMWPSRLRPPALRWSLARHSSTRATTSPRGPRNSLRRREFPQPISDSKKHARAHQAPNNASSDVPAQTDESLKAATLSSVLHETNPKDNSLLSPVHIPEDPNGVLKERHPATNLLSNSGLVVQRQLEMMNVMLGFEQANRYVIYDGSGNHVGYMAEQEKGMGNMMARQWFKTHRSFVTHVFDKHENEVLRVRRYFAGQRIIRGNANGLSSSTDRSPT
jgi:hypothetical protein